MFICVVYSEDPCIVEREVGINIPQTSPHFAGVLQAFVHQWLNNYLSRPTRGEIKDTQINK